MLTLLTPTAGWGLLALLFIFIFSFVTVHLVFLARLGFLYQQEKTETEQDKSDPPEQKPNPTPPEQNPKTEPPTPPEPVYYIVEKKRRTNPSYSPPKQIRFK